MKIIIKILKIVFLLGLIGLGLYIYARYIEPNQLVLTQYKMKVTEEVTPSRIVFFSDTHIGKDFSESQFSKVVDLINEQEPDIVLFGGDFFDDYKRDKSELRLAFVTALLRNIEAPHGKYAVYGNHDYGGGAEYIYAKVMRDGDFLILRDESIFLESLGIRVIGFDDLFWGDTNPELYTLKTTTYNIIMVHEPDVADEISLPRAGMMLAGHSHGGQVSLPFITERIMPMGARKYTKGYYANTGKTENIPLIVSSGIGTSVLPLRFGNPPEIVVVDLVH